MSSQEEGFLPQSAGLEPTLELGTSFNLTVSLYAFSLPCQVPHSL